MLRLAVVAWVVLHIRRGPEGARRLVYIYAAAWLARVGYLHIWRGLVGSRSPVYIYAAARRSGVGYFTHTARPNWRA